MAYSNTVKNKFTKFLNLTFKDKIKTVVYILTFHLLVFTFRIFGYKKTKNLVDKTISTRNNSENENFIVNESKNISYASSNSLIKTTCLEKSLFTYLILGIHGIKSELKIGVNKSTDDLSAHAWVEYKDKVLTYESSSLKNFTTF